MRRLRTSQPQAVQANRSSQIQPNLSRPRPTAPRSWSLSHLPYGSFACRIGREQSSQKPSDTATRASFRPRLYRVSLGRSLTSAHRRSPSRKFGKTASDLARYRYLRWTLSNGPFLYPPLPCRKNSWVAKKPIVWDQPKVSHSIASI